MCKDSILYAYFPIFMRCFIEFRTFILSPIRSIVYIDFIISYSARKMLRWTIVVAIGCERSGGMKRTNRRIRVPDSMYPCSDKERMFIEYVGKDEVERFITTLTSREGVVTKYPGKFRHFSGKGKVVQSKPHKFVCTCGSCGIGRKE